MQANGHTRYMVNLIKSSRFCLGKINTATGKAYLVAATLLTLVAGCQPTENSPAGINSPLLSPQQNQLYEQSCKNCHENTTNPSPQTHDVVAWKTRLDKGLPVLVKNSMQGFNAMPPGGLCAICTPTDFEALILYMASPTSK